MADDESESREGAAITQDQFALLMGAFSASQTRESGVCIASVVNDDSCGVLSRPYHSCVIACVMQVREELAMGHDSGAASSSPPPLPLA